MEPGLVQFGSCGLWIAISEGTQFFSMTQNAQGYQELAQELKNLMVGVRTRAQAWDHSCTGIGSQRWVSVWPAHVLQLKPCYPLWRHPRPTLLGSPDGCN